MLEVSGHAGGKISIPCFGSWTTDESSEHNRMYFCRGVCNSKNTLIKTEMKKSAATRQGRYSMEYDGGDGVFTVTIRRLRTVDAGRYHCEVERTFNASYQEVSLKVLDGKLLVR